MKLNECTEEQCDTICGYFLNKYDAGGEGAPYWEGKDCSCAHCPFGIDNPEAWPATSWICGRYYLGNEQLSPELEQLIKGDSNAS